jgi:hypothetical protein
MSWTVKNEGALRIRNQGGRNENETTIRTEFCLPVLPNPFGQEEYE